MQNTRWLLSILCFLIGLSILCFLIGLSKLFTDFIYFSYKNISLTDKIISYGFLFFGGIAIYYTTLIASKNKKK